MSSITRGCDLSHLPEAWPLAPEGDLIWTESPRISDIWHVAFTPILFVTYGTLTRKLGRLPTCCQWTLGFRGGEGTEDDRYVL